MVFFNYATMQMAAKIVYYGPGLCGKTTNLHYIYTKTSPQSRGEMVSLETETDRTLFFDLLPIDVGVIGGFKTRLQLYTVPGQVFYNTTRKLVLKGVDGIVFVADSQRAMLDANVESFKNLRENLAEIGLNVEELPLVLQLNKRDLPNVAEPELITSALDPMSRYEATESIAANGTGVFETLKLISKLTLRTLRRRMTGEEPVKPGRKLADVAAFRVKEEPRIIASARTMVATPHPGKPAIRTTATPASPTFTAPAAAASAGATTEPMRSMPAVDEIEVLEPSDEIASEPLPESTLGAVADVDRDILASAPIEEIRPSSQYIPPALPTPLEQHAPAPVSAASAAEPEPEVDFSQTEKPAKVTPEMKHVKVRSSVDIMAELEALRKRATTQSAPKVKKEVPAAISIPTPKPKRDVRHTIVLQADPANMPRAKSVKVTVSFEDDGEVLEQHEQSVELSDNADVRSLSLDVKIALE
jgi:signal recognition particle receptor subunit beta